MKYYFNKDNKIIEIETIHSVDRLKELSAEYRNVDLYDNKADVPTPEDHELIGDEFVILPGVAKAKAEEEVIRNRKSAYREESDPLFFMAERGEIDKQVWLDKIQEIKERYPKVV